MSVPESDLKRDGILIVEDDRGVAELAREALEPLGLPVSVVGTGAEAREWLKAHDAAFMLLDYALPDMTASDLVQSGPMPTFVVMTGVGDERIAVEMMKRGARDYLVKDHRLLAHLPEIVTHVLREAEVERRLLQAEESERRARETLDAVVGASPLPIIAQDLQGQVTLWNPAAESVFGWRGEEVRGQPNPAVPTEVRGLLETQVAMIQGGERLPPLVHELIRRNGARVVTEIALAPLHNRTGSVVGSMAVLNDVTERRQAEETFRRARDFYLGFVEEFPELIWRSNPDGRRNYFNSTWYAFTGRSRGQELEDGWLAGVHPEDQEKCRLAFRTAVGVVREREAEYRLRHKDGGFRWMHDQARPFKDLAGRFMGYVGACRDVTALKQEQLGLADQLLATRRTLEAALTTLSMAAEYPFPFMAGHQRRVAELAVAIARRMKLADDDVEGLRIAAVLHDIGRLTVPAEVLGSSGSLAGGELESVRRHVQSGYELLSGIHFERPVADYVAQHHERLDGSGYPRGLVKDQICLEARIIAVADVVEAMCSQRPHRPALGTLTALQEVQVHAGQLYDADVVRACADAIDAGFHFEGLPARPA